MTLAPSIASIRGSSWCGAGLAVLPETKGQTMSIKLTDTQLLMLSAAAQREDRCIAAPPSLKGAAAQKIATKLVVAGLAKETRAKRGAHVWRRDDATGLTYALKVTPAGLIMVAIGHNDDCDRGGSWSRSSVIAVASGADPRLAQDDRA